MRAWLLGMALCAGSANAADRALVLANENYLDAADIAGSADVLEAAEALRTNGFQVTEGSDLATATMRTRLSAFLADLAPGDRILIVVAGHFARSGTEAWVLGTEASAPDLAQVGGVGVSVASILEIAASAPGGALVLLGTEPTRLPLGSGLEQGIGPVTVPQGVTVVRGEAGAIAAFVAAQTVRRGTSIPAMLDDAPDLTADGFLAEDLPFRPATVAKLDPVTPAPDPIEQTAADRARDDRAYAEARLKATPEALEGYLAAFPAGRHVAEARAEVTRLRSDPALKAKLAEEALALNRDQRRAIQRQLSLLGFNPKGIDGLFGPGSRAAIAAWQQANTETVNGFLSRDQILRLTAQAERRAAELEAEAAARRAEQERQDRLFWDQTGAAGDEPGLRVYLRKYPDGLFAELAAQRLKVIEDARQAAAAAQDRAAWDRAESVNTADAYRDYLTAFPAGAFATEAQTRIQTLNDAVRGEDDRAAAEAGEAALNLNDLARNLIEQRLDGLDFDPGEVDGVFDDRTRRAIRRFQAARGLPETGYLDQAVMVGLLAGGVLRLGE